jgi:Carboxymuconolactone decarboxylase family
MDVTARGDTLGDDAGQAVIALDDALYYLRRGCESCADRHLDRARQFGATSDQIEAVLATARIASTPTRAAATPARAPGAAARTAATPARTAGAPARTLPAQAARRE